MADGKDQILDSFKNLVDWIKSGASKAGETILPSENGTQNFYEVAKSPVREASGAAARREMLAKLISSLLGLAASFGLTFFAVKWMTNAMDPTRKEKQKARERVFIAVYLVFEKHRELKQVKQEIALKKIFSCNNPLTYQTLNANVSPVFKKDKKYDAANLVTGRCRSHASAAKP